MAAFDYSQFHDLAEQFKGEMPLKRICEQEGISTGRISHGGRRTGLRRKPISLPIVNRIYDMGGRIARDAERLMGTGLLKKAVSYIVTVRKKPTKTCRF